MFSDARIRASLDTMVRGIDAPPVILHQIQRRILQQSAIPRYMPHYLRLAISAAVIIAMLVIALPSISPALVQTIEARYRAALQALGVVRRHLHLNRCFRHCHRSRATQRLQARSRVYVSQSFRRSVCRTMLSPRKSGRLPRGVYSKITRSWSVGPRQ